MPARVGRQQALSDAGKVQKSTGRRRNRRGGSGLNRKMQGDKRMARVVMYSTMVCPYCQMAERLLRSKGVETIEKIMIDREPGKREEMMSRTGRRTVPQIYIDDRHVGGFDDLSALDRQGGLAPLLAA